MRLSRIVLSLLLVLMVCPAHAADLWRPKGQPAFVDSNGAPYAGAKLCFFDAGTSSQKTVYKDAAAATPWSQPITLNAGGGLTDPVYVGSGAFKEKLMASTATTCNDTALYTSDDIPGALDTTSLEVEFAKQDQPVLAKASDYTVVADDLGSLITANAVGNNLTITLPSAATAGDGGTLAVKKTDASANTVTLATVGGQTIDGASTLVLSTQNQTVAIVSDGAAWYAQGRVVPAQITATEIATDGVGSAEIAASAVGTSEIADGTVADADLRNSAALSVVGRSANSTGSVADIVCSAGSDGVIRESGSALGCGTVATAGIADSAVTFGKLASSAVDNDSTLAANSASKLPTQAAVKAYVDTAVASGIKWKEPVRVATTANGTLATAFDDASTVDGVTLATGDRILIKNQSAPAENGIYVVAASGAPSRATDSDTETELIGATVYVEEGSANAATQWTQTETSITVDSTDVTFVLIAAGVTYTADGSTLSLAGQQFSVATGGIGQTQIATGGVASAEIQDGTVALGDMANLATDRLIGRDTAGSGAPEALTVGGGLEFTGSGGIQRSAFSGGDVTAAAGSADLQIGSGVVGATEIATDGVDSAEIAANAVGLSEMGDDAVGSAELDFIDGDTPADEDCVTVETGGSNGSLESQACVTDGDKGDISVSAGVWSVDANSVALGTDTTGNYAAGDAEAGAATSGDSATSFWSTGTCEVARGCTGQGTEAEALGEMTQALTEDTTPDRQLDFAPVYDASADTGKKVALYNLAGSAVLATGTVSNGSALDIALDGYTQFKIFKLILVNVKPATDTATLYLRFSDDGGSSFEADASDYSWVFNEGLETTSPSPGSAGDNADSEIQLTGSVGASTGERVNLEITIFDPAAAEYTAASWIGQSVSGSTVASSINGSGTFVTGPATDIRIIFSSGNISSAKYTLIGYL